MLSRRNRTILGLLAVSVATVIVIALVFMRSGDDRWEAMTTRVAELQAEARSRTVPRSVLRGKPRPGNAWNEYNIALDDALTWNEDPNGTDLSLFIAGDPKVDRAKIEKMIAAHEGVLEHLRLGAERTDGQYPYKWERGDLMELPSLLASRKLAAFALAQAKIWTETGRTEEAAALLLDVSVFARDLAANGPLLSSLIGVAVYSMTFDELRNLIQSGKLTRTQLADLEKKLEIVDKDFPGLELALNNEALGSTLSSMEPTGEGPIREWVQLVKQDGWRYGFSSRRMAIDAFEERENYLRRSQNFDQMTFSEVKKEAAAIATEAERSFNPIIRSSMPSLPRIVVMHRDALAKLRLLRAGTGFLATGELPVLQDPFGKNLLHVQEAGKLKIWSVGSDGQNQNGTGSWSTKPQQTDIVLEITR